MTADWGFSAFCWIMRAGAVVLFLAAAMFDLGWRRIPNWISPLLLFTGIMLGITRGGLPGSLAVGLVIFIAAAICWRHGLMGGGDVKLLGAGATLFPASRCLNFMLDTALFGGVLALFYMVLRCIVRKPGYAAHAYGMRRLIRVEQWRIAGQAPLPYAVAIGAAGIFLIWV